MTIKETGSNSESRDGPWVFIALFVDVLPVAKGVVWVFLSTFAEVMQAVSPAGFLAPLRFSHYITLKVSRLI